MENLLGLIRVHVKRGINLAVRDVRSSDPYVVISMGRQRLKTRVIRNDMNPEWDEDLTLSVSDTNSPISLIVFDHDKLSMDDKMGEAEIDINPFMEAVKKMRRLGKTDEGTVIAILEASRRNCLSKDGLVTWRDGSVVQEICLRLNNVECGEVEVELQWIDIPCSKRSL